MLTKRGQTGPSPDMDRQAQMFLMADNVWKNAKTVAMYMAIRNEVDCSLLLQKAKAEGKQILLPKIVEQAARKMEFVLFQDALQPGPWGIMEPVGPPANMKIDLLIAPGAAFDLNGNRLGYGGGFYDRYITNHPQLIGKVVGLCRAFQIVPNVPVDNLDKPVNALCSEKGLVWL